MKTKNNPYKEILFLGAMNGKKWSGLEGSE